MTLRLPGETDGQFLDRIDAGWWMRRKRMATEAQLRKSTPRGKQLEDLAWKHIGEALRDEVEQLRTMQAVDAALLDVAKAEIERLRGALEWIATHGDASVIGCARAALAQRTE